MFDTKVEPAKVKQHSENNLISHKTESPADKIEEEKESSIQPQLKSSHENVMCLPGNSVSQEIQPISKPDIQMSAGSEGTAGMSVNVEESADEEEIQMQVKPGQDLNMTLPDENNTEESDSEFIPIVQAKLKIGQPGDKYEREADLVAARVMRTPDLGSNIDSKIQAKEQEIIQPKCTACEEEIELRMKPDINKSQGDSNSVSDDIQSSLSATAGMGQSIQPSVRKEMEGKMGTDFSDVKIHTGSNAIQMNENLGAKAFTHGSDIYFNKGNYAPGSSGGKRLLAHELTHVVQQTGKVQTFTTPDIQKFDAHDEIEKKLREKNGDMITEAPIPGGQADGKGFTKFGYADLYKSTGSKLAGIYGRKYNKDKDKDTGVTTEKFAYDNVTNKRLAHKPEGTFKYGPELLKRPISVYVSDDGTRKYFEGLKEVPESTKSSMLTGVFPADFYVGDIKKGADDLSDAKRQLKRYQEGLRDFSQDANNHFGIAAMNKGQLYTDAVVPPGLDYSDFANQNKTLGDGYITERAGGTTRRYWLYPDRKSGLYLYIWLPHPWRKHVPKYQKTGKEVMDELDKLNKGLKVKQKKPGKSIDTKRKEGAILSKNKPNEITNKSNQKVIQKKDTDWAAHKKAYFTARKKWIKDYGKKYLKKKEIKNVVENKVDFDKALGISITAHGEFGAVAKQFKKIEFWEGPKGFAVGELRFLLGDKFDKLADKFEELKKRTKKTRAKANKLSGSKISFGWKKKVIQLLMEGFKVGFKVFIAETYSIFAGCIGGMTEKFEKSFSEMEDVEELKKQLDGLKTQIESLLNEIETKYAAQMKLFESILDQMEDIKFYADILSTAETLIRAGVQIVSCFSPPALGCLWGLVAQVGMEVALDLVVGTEWFENKFMRPLVKDLIDKFLKDDILKFMNQLFKDVGLENYINGVEQCKVSAGAKGGGSGIGWYNKGPKIPASQYKKHAIAWEAKHKATLLQGVATAFTNGTKGKTVTTQDVEKFLKAAQDKNMSADDFKAAVNKGKVGENKFDFNVAQAEVGSAGGEGKEGGKSDVKVIDASKVSTNDTSKGFDIENVKGAIQAHTSHTKGSKPNLTIYLYENGKHVATIINVPSVVTKRVWWPSSKRRKKLKIYYTITKRIPVIKDYFIRKGTTGFALADP